MNNDGTEKFSDIVKNEYGGDYKEASRDFLLHKTRSEIKAVFPTMTEDEVRKFMKEYIDIIRKEYPGGSKVVTDEDYFTRKLHLTVEN